MEEKNVAVILAGGKGTRMNSQIPKQYLEVNGKPLICYTMDVFERSFIDEMVVVVGTGEMDYFQKNILGKHAYNKVSKVVEGGKERYHSVLNGLRAIKNADFVYIHDGARACLREELLERGKEAVRKYGAVAAAVPVKDTIKIVEQGKIVSTPPRNVLWQIQTPQVFSYDKIKSAYEKMMTLSQENITDDAMVMERFGDVPVYIYEGEYTNIKITTPDDLDMAKNILKNI